MRVRTLLANAGLMLASLAVAAVLTEVVLRFVYPAPIRWTFPQEYYEFDPVVAHKLRPNQQAYTHDKPVSVNSLGLRDRDYPSRPPAGVRRALGLGDSQTFGNGVALSESWPKQVEAALNREGASPRWEWLNAGVPGTDTWQHELMLERLLEAYHPDAVVLAFYANDVSPSYEPKPRNIAAKTNTFEKRVAYLLKRTTLVSLVQQRLAGLKVAKEIEKGHAIGQYIVTGEPHERVERGWQQVSESLASMKRSADARGVQFLLAILPRRDQVAGAMPSRVYNERVVRVAKRHGIETLDLLPALEAAYAEHGADLFIAWDGHNSGVANAVIGREVARQIERLEWGLASR